MADFYSECELANGLKLLVEPIDGFESAALSLMVPAGVVADPKECWGTANVLSDLVTRGAGPRNNRQLARDLDNLGVQRTESTGIFHTTFTAATLAKNLLPALGILADVVRQPRLETEQLDFCKQAALQEIEAIEDEPAQKIVVELKRRFLPDPLGRPVTGTAEHVRRIDSDTVRRTHQQNYRPNGAILGIAGAVDFEQVRRDVEHLFGDWEGRPAEPFVVTDQPAVREHLHADKVQTHIAIAFDSVSYRDADFYNAHGAVGVLSGGMSARLFTEVREKRGLCYSVGASFHPLKDRGFVLCYAGTTNERAAETLEVVLAELGRLREGISEAEVRRVRAGLKSSLIMKQESTVARASVLARSWFYLGRVRGLQEINREIDRLTPRGILDYLERHPPGEYTILTLGPEPLEVPA